MCGIAGELRFDQTRASSNKIDLMLGVMRPRGPDGSGLFSQNTLCFGHRRLKIIDLSDHAAQPMVDSELGLVIVFNGCIYNYPKLRKELKIKGYKFFSHGDTEIILKAYHAWGKNCVKHFHGMFAFAIWERDSKCLFIARDRLGIKPFYFIKNENFMRFASTLPALLRAGDVNTSVDPVALHYYMSFHSVVPAPHTIFNGVKKLPPATIMTIGPDGQTKQEVYWNLDYCRSEDDLKCGENEWTDMVHDALVLAVKRHLVADVPVGVLLSGGLDSSLVVGLLSELGQKNISTFSVGFENMGGEEGNEFHYSDIIADCYGTDHHKIHIGHAELQSNISACVKSMAEPMVSHDAIGFYLLSREVSKHVKVVQSGQGADEVFAGYHWYPPLLDITDGGEVKKYANIFFDQSFEEYKSFINEAYLGNDYASQFVKNHFELPNITDTIDKALRLDTTVMLVDDPVKRVDNMTMAWGLEARVPFLDHELVELAAKIPATYKVKNGGKYVLKEAGRRIIPHEVIDRPKGYFPVPALKYMQGDYLEMARRILSQKSARERNLFDQTYVDVLLKEPMDHITPLRGSKLWQITLLEYWLQEQGI